VFFGSRTVYLVMELCKGGELFDEVTRKAQRGMPEATAGRMVRTTRTHVNLPVTPCNLPCTPTSHLPHHATSRGQVADMFSALHYLHAKGIAHRDLKLENFLFEDTSADKALKLIDFGLSKTFTPGEVLRQVVGSAYYTAPEVRMGSQSEG
jgi:calcium-dependent protein kinase